MDMKKLISYRLIFILFNYILICKCNDRMTIRRYFQKESEILSRYPGQDDYISPTTHVVAVAGGLATLPCDLSSSEPDDPAVLVLWYKNGVVKPIYSYDSRKGEATHWKSSVHMGNRATFDPSRGELVIQQISTKDEDSYRCRVHFKTNPTLSYVTNLTIIIPPSRLMIVAPSGLEAENAVGPYQVGDTLRLRCEAVGGDPSPKVTWWDGNAAIDDQDEIMTPHQVANIFLLERLRREDLNRVLTCTASNTNLSAPLRTSVTIDMNFSPKIVRILSGKDPLSAGRRYEVTCQAAGSRPTANIKWHIKSTTLSTFTSQTSEDGNITTSTLQFTPQIEDNQKDLQCIGTSPALLRFPVIDSWKLNVFFPPKAKIRAGSSLNLGEIKENDDVYFECDIKANPPVYKIIWYHQGVELRHNVTSGIIISNQSLALQHVHRSATGLYSCKASNIEGDGASGTIELIVKFRPICNKKQALFHGAAPKEKVDIPCLVEAYPAPDFFTWTFNNSGESVNIPDDRIQMKDFHSTVSYTPRTELDYGTLLCRATNAVGIQNEPCVFHVFPAGRPDPVHNCTQFNFSESAVNIRCHPGFDGGLPQSFFIELYDSKSRLFANVTRQRAFFSIDGLPSATSFDAFIHPLNNKGRGEGYSIKTYTLKDNAEKRTAAIKPAPSADDDPLLPILTPILAITLGVAIGLISAIVIIVSVLRLRQKRAGVGLGDSTEDDPQKSSAVKGEASEDPKKGSSTQILLRGSPLSSDNDEVNPDLIPRKGDHVIWSENNSLTEGDLKKKLPSSKVILYSAQGGSADGYYDKQHSNTQAILRDSHSLNESLCTQYDLSSGDTLKRQRLRERRELGKEDTTLWEGEYPPEESQSDVSYRSSAMPWSHSSSYQNKLRLGKELETIEPLLSSQRESSV